jgi:hypothetical protein
MEYSSNKMDNNISNKKDLNQNNNYDEISDKDDIKFEYKNADNYDQIDIKSLKSESFVFDMG